MGTRSAVLCAAAVVSLAACNGKSSSTPTNPNPVVLVPAAGTRLPDGTVGVVYSQTFTVASGGTSPYVLVPAGVPPGLTFVNQNGSSGTLSGTPTTAGQGTLAIQVLDAANQTTDATYTIAVLGAGGALVLTPTAAPATKANATYSFTFAVIGGTAPYNFTLQGSLPPGLSLGPSVNGVAGQATISGSAVATGTYPFTVNVGDAATPQHLGSQAYTITVTQ